MYSLILNFLTAKGVYLPIAAYAICMAIGLVACIVIRKVVSQLLISFFKRFTGVTQAALTKNKFFTRLAHLTVPIIISFIATDIGLHAVFWSRVVSTLLIIFIVLFSDSIIRSIGDIYSAYEVSKTVPLRGVFQVLEIIVFVVGGIVLISVFIDRSPATLLGSIGAMTAIVTIVFKDAILGLVAGIQLTANDMVSVGDIIDLPQRQISGTVLDISLITVKVESFDKTIVAIPAYTLVSEPFVNRRGMLLAEARRITRSFIIDANTIDIHNCAPHTTNIGAFREHITTHLRSRTDINQELTILVRQLQASGMGIPIEVYAFTTATDLVTYENIQSDIFEHIYSTLPDFGLKLYQRG